MQTRGLRATVARIDRATSWLAPSRASRKPSITRRNGRRARGPGARTRTLLSSGRSERLDPLSRDARGSSGARAQYVCADAPGPNAMRHSRAARRALLHRMAAKCFDSAFGHAWGCAAGGGACACPGGPGPSRAARAVNLEKRAWPAVREHDGGGVGVLAFVAQEVDRNPVDVDEVRRECVDRRLLRAPVVAGSPVLDQARELDRIGAGLPARDRPCRRPSPPSEPRAQIVELGVSDVPWTVDVVRHRGTIVAGMSIPPHDAPATRTRRARGLTRGPGPAGPGPGRNERQAAIGCGCGSTTPSTAGCTRRPGTRMATTTAAASATPATTR